MERLFVQLFMLATLLQLFGCGAKSEKNNAIPEEINKSLNEFQNRTIHSELTADMIDKTSDEKLLQIVFDNLQNKVSIDFSKDFEIVSSFSKPQRAIYVIWLLEAEVNNGGFNQYYMNSSGQFAQLTPDALKLVKANKFADLVARANKTFEVENEKITEQQDGTLEGFSKSYEDNPLNKFDDEFYELYKTEDLYKLQVNFIRANKADFIEK